MHVIEDWRRVAKADRGAVFAIGNFDGVHRGHQAVLEIAKAQAGKLSARAGAIVFDPHPRRFFQPDAPHFTLTPLPMKLWLFERFGLDIAAVLGFDRQMAGMEAERFVEQVLLGGLGVAHVVIGYDFFFGKGRVGTPDTMRMLAERHGFGLTVVPPQSDGGEAFGSTAIRSLLRAGDVAAAARQLGYWWRVEGTVVSGAGRGHGLGFPTANIELQPGQDLAHGIYAVRVELDGVRHDAAAYLGTRPTFDNGKPMLEVFLLDFEGDLYQRQIAVELIAYLRGDRAFASTQDLSDQMALDTSHAREILAGTAASPL